VPISKYLKDGSAFDPEDILTMSKALLAIDGDARARETVAIRIIELVRRGEHNADRLRDQRMIPRGVPSLGRRGSST
jgi:hypothetical protein